MWPIARWGCRMIPEGDEPLPQHREEPPSDDAEIVQRLREMDPLDVLEILFTTAMEGLGFREVTRPVTAPRNPTPHFRPWNKEKP